MLGELVCGGANVAYNGSSGTPSLCILGSPYSLGGLKPAGQSCRRVSSVSEDFFSSSMVFRSIESVGSFVIVLYAGSSRREEIFCL